MVKDMTSFGFKSKKNFLLVDSWQLTNHKCFKNNNNFLSNLNQKKAFVRTKEDPWPVLLMVTLNFLEWADQK